MEAGERSAIVGKTIGATGRVVIAYDLSAIVDTRSHSRSGTRRIKESKYPAVIDKTMFWTA